MKKVYFFTFLVFFLATELIYAQQFELSQEISVPKTLRIFNQQIAQVAGDQAILGSLGPGSIGNAYIFEKDDAGDWALTATLEISDIGERSRFGLRASITEDRAIVASLERAYIFEKQDGVWQQVADLAPAGGIIGTEVGISGDYAFVGKPGKDTEEGFSVGSVFVYQRTSSGVWEQTQELFASNRRNRLTFGSSLVVDGDRALIRNNPISDDFSEFYEGYVFQKNKEGLWEETAILKSFYVLEDNVAPSIALSGEYAAFGQFFNPYGDGIAPGEVKTFENKSSGWQATDSFSAPDEEDDDAFGQRLTLDGRTLLVTAKKGTYVYNRTMSGTGEWNNVQIIPNYVLVGLSGGEAIAYGADPSKVYFFKRKEEPSIAVTGFLLVDAESNQVLRSVADGDIIDLSSYENKNFNVMVKTNTNDIGSVYLRLQTSNDRLNRPELVIERTENKTPYALFGDKKGDYRNWQPEINNYSLLAIPYPESNRQGMSGKVRAINFSVRRYQPVPVTQAADYSMFKGSNTTPEFVLVSAETNQPLQILQDGNVVNLAQYDGKNFNIVAKTSSVGSVMLELRLNNMLFIRRPENKFPYAAFGDTDEAFRNWEPELGNYSLKATTYLYRFAEGSIASQEINFRIINDPIRATVAESKTETARLSLYPNPAVYQVNAKVEATQSYQLSVFDRFGQKVFSKTGKGRLEESINLSGKQPGLYMVVLEANGQRESQRLILQ